MASITEVEEGLKDWALLKQLPQNLEGFNLVEGSGIKGQILNIAAYVNDEKHCRLDITYTTETFDYVPVKTIGLHTFRDERYFCRDREKFGEMLQQHLQQILVTPEHPLEYLNGSTIFLDYTDFENGNQIYFSYNAFRNDVFAEMKQHYLPLTTNLYDVPSNIPDAKKLLHLETLLKKHLETTLKELSTKE